MNEDERQKAYYKKVFGTERPRKEYIKAALNQAHQAWKIEIRLYWQRSLFIWGFILTYLGGLFLLKKIEYPDFNDLIAIMLLSFLGLFTSLAWPMLEVASRSWQQNWEYHIQFLENEITGKLYKTTLGRKNRFYSISNIHRSIILAIMLFWTVITAITVYDIIYEINNNQEMVMWNWEWVWYGCLALIIVFIYFLRADTVYFKGSWRMIGRSMPDEGQKRGELALYQGELPDIKFPDNKQ